VSTAVYKAVARGEFAHVRASSVIRILLGATDQAALSMPEAVQAAMRPVAGLRANPGSSRTGKP